MNLQLDKYFGRTLLSGALAGLTTAATAALAGRRETDSYAAPLNATSHMLWGDTAAVQDRPSLKYTLSGILLNYGAATFWAAIYEKLFAPAAQRDRNSIMRPLLGAAVVTAGAYVTDYYLVPERFTPGFEKRLSGKALAAIYGMLAVGMVARSLVQRRSR